MEEKIVKGNSGEIGQGACMFVGWSWGSFIQEINKYINFCAVVKSNGYKIIAIIKTWYNL